MTPRNFAKYLAEKKPYDSQGELDWNEIKDIAYAADEWRLRSVALSHFDWVADPTFSNKSKFPPIVLKTSEGLDVLDGKHRIGMANAKYVKYIKMWVGYLNNSDEKIRSLRKK